MSSNLPAGTTLKSNSYCIQRLLGQGGFGDVYLAQDLVMQKLCAIKDSSDTSPGAQKQFDVEARILAHLNHPILPRVTDNFVEPSGNQYLVMEYVEGQDLSELLEQSGPLPEDKVLVWIDQVLDAVAYLHVYHPRPVIHRDIKPGNIRLLPDGKTVKLVDFGIAKVGGVTDKTRGAARGYSPGYSPPEQYGTGTDTYSDVYALGATLYHLLTHVLPPESVDLLATGAQLDPPRKLNPQISQNVEQIILTAMQLDPKLRFSNAGEMRLALKGKRPTTVLVTCARCGTAVRAAARFCSSCGHALRSAAPFVFQQSGYRANDVKELVRGCDTYWDEAASHFRQGDLDAWLRQLGTTGQQLAGQGQTIRARHRDPWAALEEFLEKADPTRSLPLLTVNPTTTLDFGALRSGDSRTLCLTVSNSGRGYLYGTVQTQTSWVHTHPASFGCLAGAAQQVEIEVATIGLSGTELGVDYRGQVTILSNRGQQTVPIHAKVVEEPQAHLDPTLVDLGAVTWGATVQGQVMVSNSGGGTLHGTLVPDVAWIAVEQSGQPFSLGKGQLLPMVLRVDTSHFVRRDRYSGRLQVQTKGRGAPAAVVSIQVDAPYPLDPSQPATAVSTVDELVTICDASWEWGVYVLTTGRIEAFLCFVGEDALAQTAVTARQHPDPNVGLETLLRAARAKPPQKHRTNLGDVLSQLGFGLLPKLRSRPPVVKLLIENTSRRGYLHGHVDSLVPWLTVPQPRFGCLPGQVAEVELCADRKAKKGGFFSLGVALFEIVVE